jgi:hypothetical protein
VVVDQLDGDPTAGELRRFLDQKLPDYMLPSAFVFLDEMPRLPNGKVDRRALPAPDTSRPDLGEGFVDPCTEMESLLAGIWREVLGLDQVGVYDNFFDLGGHSLLSLQVIARVEERTGVRVNPRDVIRQTLGQLATLYEEQMPLLGSPEPVSFGQRLWRAIRSLLCPVT